MKAELKTIYKLSGFYGIGTGSVTKFIFANCAFFGVRKYPQQEGGMFAEPTLPQAVGTEAAGKSARGKIFF